MRAVFGVLGNLAVPILLRTLHIEKFVIGIFQHERKIASYHSKPVPIHATKTMPEEHKGKAQDATVIEEDVSYLVCLAKQT